MMKTIKYLTSALFVFFACFVLWNMLEVKVRAFLTTRRLNSESNVQLHIHLNSTLTNFPKPHSFILGTSSTPSVWEIDQGLRAAADDPKITSALIHIDCPQLTVNQAYALGYAIKYFRSKNKTIECYASSFGAENGGLPAYLLATYCNKIMLQRMGQVRLEALKVRDISLEKQVGDIIHKHRGVSVDITPFTDKQALKHDLIDVIVPHITHANSVFHIQDYVRFSEKLNVNSANTVEVIPFEDNINDGVHVAYQRPDVQAIVVHVNSGTELEPVIETIKMHDHRSLKIPMVMHAADAGMIDGRIIGYVSSFNNSIRSTGTLHNAIELAINFAKLDASTVRIDIIQTESLMSTVINDVHGVWQSIKAMFNRSINHVTKMTCGAG